MKDKTGTGGTIKLTAAPQPQAPAVVAAVPLPVATPNHEALLAVLEADFELLEVPSVNTSPGSIDVAAPLGEYEQLEAVCVEATDFRKD